jgi:dTDP-4-amino-4,6-dideoxygalactose transaminase
VRAADERYPGPETQKKEMSAPPPVPLLDLRAQHDAIRQEVLAAVEQIFDSQRFILGPPVEQLERRLAEYCGCEAGVGVSSGTDALLCCLMALELEPGDQVVTSPYSFFATAGSIWRTGARPVFVDIDPQTFNLDPAGLEAALGPRTRAIVPVHLFGQTAEMDPILELARARGLPVIEDAAQAIGASHRGRRAGSLGDAGCLSFFPSKNLGGAGDGGMIVTRDGDLARRLALLRAHGGRQLYEHKLVGGNFRLDALQAAVLLVKLEHLDRWSAARRDNAARYDRLLAQVPEVTPPVVRPHNVSVFNQYVIRAERRDRLREHLTRAGIGTQIYYPRCLHRQPCFAELGYREGSFPRAERAAAESLALPIFPELGAERLARVAGAIAGFYGRRLEQEQDLEH